jgi:hypothetical protein
LAEGAFVEVSAESVRREKNSKAKITGGLAIAAIFLGGMRICHFAVCGVIALICSEK